MEMTQSDVTSSSTVDTTDAASVLSVEDEDDDDNDDQEQEDDEPVNAPSTNTMLHDKDIDPTNTTLLTFAPIFHEPLAEYLCFPTIFCGQQHAPNSERIHPLQQ